MVRGIAEKLPGESLGPGLDHLQGEDSYSTMGQRTSAESREDPPDVSKRTRWLDPLASIDKQIFRVEQGALLETGELSKKHVGARALNPRE